MKQLLSVKQIRQPCKFISMHTANQMSPASANLIVHLHRKVCGCSRGWKAVGACCFHLSTCAVSSLLTANNNCKKFRGAQHRSKGPKKNRGVEKPDCCHQNCYSYWLTEGPPETWCRLNNSPL